MPRSTFRHRAVTPATPPEVWERLQDPAVWADVAGVGETSGHRHADGLLRGFDFTAHVAGVAYRGRADVDSALEAESMVLAIRSNELTGTISVDILSAEFDTALDVAMTMQPAGFVGSMVFPLVSGAVESGFPDAVERLARRMS